MKRIVLLAGCLLLALRALAAEPAGDWFDFRPTTEDFSPGSVIDLRRLNEPVAGAGGFIEARDGQFRRAGTGEAVRFWAVNGPSAEAGTTRAALETEARILAKYGVNLVRIHGPAFDRNGEPDPVRVRHVQDTVAAMKAQGIYSHLSIFFPLWFDPAPDNAFLEGYNGKQHAYAALMFNPAFQAKYRDWWRAVLLTPAPDTGRRLVDEPAVFGAEMQNEDSLFFWTFNERNLPEPQLRMLERKFGDWLTVRYGSPDAALEAWDDDGLLWKDDAMPRDDPESGRIAFRPLWNIVNEQTPRDRDTALFLLETQTAFYRETYRFLRSIGFKGLITASNWATASARVLGPLERLSYTTGDFIDRHGYFSCNHQGEHAEWSIREGHTYADRSALRFDPRVPGAPKSFAHPGMEVRYDDLPSMISETTWNRPNRYRGEAPLHFAAYGALQDTNAIVHFAFDGSAWSVKPRFWMQPWTLMSPALFGQFPAAALIYREGLVAPGALLATLRLNVADLKALKGTPLPQDATFDELRARDVPDGGVPEPGEVIDPLVHFAGRTRVVFTDQPGAVSVEDLRPFVDRERQRISSSTGQLTLRYGPGLLRIDAPAAQGVSGKLDAEAVHALSDVEISSPLDPGHVVVVALDGLPLATSKRMLLQVMSEERTTGFATEPAGGGLRRITRIGTDPWQVRTMAGSVRFRRPDAGALRVTPLDFNGRPVLPGTTGPLVVLGGRTLYYLVKAPRRE